MGMLLLRLLPDVVLGGWSQQLLFRYCTIPNAAVATICNGVLSDSNAGALSGQARLRAVRFEECELSQQAEQHLLATLEQCDGCCVMTIDGGTTRDDVDDSPMDYHVQKAGPFRCPTHSAMESASKGKVVSSDSCRDGMNSGAQPGTITSQDPADCWELC